MGAPMSIEYLISPDDLRAFTKGFRGPDDRLVTVAVASRLSGLSRRQIEYALQSRRLTGYKLDQETHGYLLRLSDVLELEPPRRGRPPKIKKLSDDDCGYVI